MACASFFVTGFLALSARGGLAVEPKRGDTLSLALNDAVAIQLIFLPPGEFTMGGPDPEPGREADEGPVTRVRHIKGFWLGKTEVTQAEWQAVMTSNPSRFPNAGARAPVERVTWDEAMAFFQKITEQGHLPRGRVGRRPFPLILNPFARDYNLLKITADLEDFPTFKQFSPATKTSPADAITGPLAHNLVQYQGLS